MSTQSDRAWREGADRPAVGASGDSPQDAVPAARRFRSLNARERVAPTWTSTLVEHASRPFGGPLGRHALVGRQWFWTPLRVILLLAVIGLSVGWLSKAACIQSTGGKHPSLDWGGNRPYVAMCYSDTVPLYGAERLDHAGFLPYRDGWLEVSQSQTDSDPKTTTLYATGNGDYRVDDRLQAVDAHGNGFELDPGDVIHFTGKTSFELQGRVIDLPAGSQQRFMEYPVLTGLFQWGVAQLTHAWQSVPFLPHGIDVAVYFDLCALTLSFAWLATVWATARTARRRIWDAALVGLSPLVMVHAFTNFDMLATACAAGGLLAWSRRRPALAGILFGLGIAAKLYPLFLLGPLFVVCLRAGKLRHWTVSAATTAAAWVVVNAPIALAYPLGWREFLRLNTERGMDPDSLYNVVHYFTGWAGFDGNLADGQAPTILNAVTAVLFLIACAGIVYVALTAPQRPRVAQLCFLVVAAFLLTNKVWSPQFSLWLVPLAVLAVPNWRLLLTWMTVDALVWAPRMAYYLGTDNRGLPEGWFLGAVVLRDLVVVIICAVIVYQIYRPRSDDVRAVDDDPAGGVVDRAPDVYTLPALRRRKPPSTPSPAPRREPVRQDA